MCPKCGGLMIAALLPYNKEDIGLIKKTKPTEEEEVKEVKRLYKNASLVKEYGAKAMMTLSGRGIGPDTAARVLSGFYDSEDEFLRDILTAELTYARTKRFWD